MRIILDSNIFVSALISPVGAPGRVYSMTQREPIRLVTSAAQLEEMRRVFGRPALRSRIAVREVEGLFTRIGQIADVAINPPAVDFSDDPDDNLILAAAIAGRADLIVSGDKKHMLSLGQVEGIPIITPAEALHRLNAP